MMVEGFIMLTYSFLKEAEVVDTQQQNTVPTIMPTSNQQAISFSSVFRPLHISGITIKTRNAIMAEGSAKLSRINYLIKKLQTSATNPSNKNIQLDKIKLKYAQDAYKLHHEFISKTIFWKSRVKLIMGPQFLQLREQYTRALFTLEQAYKRSELKLTPVKTNNY